MSVMAYAEWSALWTHIGHPGNARPPGEFAPVPWLHRPNPANVEGVNADPALPITLVQPVYAYLGGSGGDGSSSTSGSSSGATTTTTSTP